jgi:predicted small lipoprotein YifL
MKNLIKFFAISICVLTLSSCSDEYDNTNNSNPSITAFTAMINGANEVPSTNSTATGQATASFNNTTKILTITVNHNLTLINAGHIHVAAAGANGPIVFPFSGIASPIAFISGTLTSVQEADLKANRFYINLHSAAFPSGEIRGQLIKGATTGGNSGPGGGGGGY